MCGVLPDREAAPAVGRVPHPRRPDPSPVEPSSPGKKGTFDCYNIYPADRPEIAEVARRTRSDKKRARTVLGMVRGDVEAAVKWIGEKRGEAA